MKIFSLLPIGFSLFLARICGKRTPLFISWQITNRCNARCRYCDYWKYSEETELNTQEVSKIIGELARLGTRAISFTGGEPLLRRDIGQIADFAVSKGITCKINSNGVLIPKLIGELSGITQVNLSFDGSENVHDLIRGKGSYRAVFEAVDALKKRNKKVAFHTVLSKYNFSEIDSILDKCRETGVGTFFQPATEVYLLKKDANPHSPDKESFNNAIDKLLKRKRRGDKHILNSVSGLRHLAFWPYPRPIFCAAGKIMFRINSRGEFYNCERFLDNTAVNCLKDGVEKALLKGGPFNGCSQCWCGPLVELNLLMQGKIDVIINSLRYI